MGVLGVKLQEMKDAELIAAISYIMCWLWPRYTSTSFIDARMTTVVKC